MRNNQWRLWISLAAAIAVTGFSAFASVASLVPILSAAHGGTGQAPSVIVAVGGIVILVASIWWTMHVEHLLRMGGSAGHPGTMPRRPRHRLRRWLHRRHGVFATLEGALVFSFFAILLLVGIVHQYGRQQRTHYVQAHGEPWHATVLSVRIIYNSNGLRRHWYTSEISAALKPPVDGQADTTVYYPFRYPGKPGQSVSVLVDPNNPSYAELPNAPYENSYLWITASVLEVPLLVLAGIFWYKFSVRIIHPRRQHSTMSSSA